MKKDKVEELEKVEKLGKKYIITEGQLNLIDLNLVQRKTIEVRRILRNLELIMAKDKDKKKEKPEETNEKEKSETKESSE